MYRLGLSLTSRKRGVMGTALVIDDLDDAGRVAIAWKNWLAPDAVEVRLSVRPIHREEMGQLHHVRDMVFWLGR